MAAGPVLRLRRAGAVVGRTATLWACLSAVCAGGACLSTACAGAEQATSTPRGALDAYAAALRQGHAQQAYALLSDSAKKNLPLKAFQRMLEENPDEVRKLAQRLKRPTGQPLLSARVLTPSGEQLLLVYERGQWRVDATALDLYGQSTPEAAITAFLRALENQRYDILMRFAPTQQRQGLSPQKLKQAWAGTQREEMERLAQALKAALPTARFEILGDRASMAYGTGGTVELLLENGAWKIEEFK